jgi:hypothetical protein
VAGIDLERVFENLRRTAEEDKESGLSNEDTRRKFGENLPIGYEDIFHADEDDGDYDSDPE